MIDKKTIDTVIETANAHIVDVVGDYVQLKRRGANYMGCCPFHQEKTPSFSVSPAKGYCYCFGCHKGGNALNFIMEMEKIPFPDAIRHLGNRFGIEVAETVPSAEAQQANRERENLFAITEYACRYFETTLKESKEGQAMGLTYLRSRGFRDDTIATFRLGYSLAQRDAFIQHATRDGYTEERMLKAGLISVSESGSKTDKFRGRVIFPIQNPMGKVIGFGGRVLDARTKGVTLKYLNSPETELYVKSDIVYGIYQARTAISRQDKCYLVEGYTDVISMHQAGIENVVSSSGTALTVNQIRLIKRFTENITVLYDGDSAGVHASLRGIDMILHEGMNVRVLLLPAEDDPDSFVRKHTTEEFLQYAAESEKDFISFEAEKLMADAGTDPIRKAQTIHTLVNSIAEVQDAIKRELYVKECSKIMDVAQETLFAALQKRMTENAVKQRDRDVAAERMQERERRMSEERSAAVQPPADIAEGLSPNEMAMMSGGNVSARPAQQPTQTNISSRPEKEFSELMRLFVSYTQEKLDMPSGEQKTVGDYVVEALDADGIVSRDEIHNRIINEYKSAADKSAIDANYLLRLTDSDITFFVAHALSREELSRIHSRFTVVTPEEKLLNEIVPRAVNELRFRRLSEMTEDLMNQIKIKTQSGASAEELTELLETLRDYNEVRRQFSTEMGERSIIN